MRIAISLLLTLAACAAPDASGTGSAPGADAGVTADDNTRFVIPAVDNSNTVTTASTVTVTNFVPGDALTYQFPVQDGIAGINAQIVLNSTANACADANTNAYHAGESQLVITLTNIPDNRMVPGTYIFPAAANAPYEIASATYASIAAPCTYASVDLVSGTVQLTDVEYNSMSGSYNLVFASGTVTGSFSMAVSCSSLSGPPPIAPNCP